MSARIRLRSLPEPVGRHRRPAGFAVIVASTLLFALPAQPVAAAVTAIQISEASGGPQWISSEGERPAQLLIGLLQSSNLDGLDPQRFNTDKLKRAVAAAENGGFAAADKANALLDAALVSYVTALRNAPTGDWIINDRGAVPAPPTAEELLADAARAPSLETWLRAMPFMHPEYAELRRALAQADTVGNRQSADLIRINLQRVRLLPAGGRYVMVNTAAQKLYMYEDGKVVDEMKVVVGKAHQPTPMMAATIKFTALNPYWQIPSDLAAERVAPHVVKQGLSYLADNGYVVLSDWGERAQPVDPSMIDWQAVADGKILVRLRQDPGPHNAMGRMKFMFPNPQGIYLHDTPNKELLNEDARLFSGGCVRLEDAPRLAQWIYGRPLEWRGAAVEQPVELPKPLPVYLIYQTAVASGDQVTFYQDIYGKDRSLLAGSNASQVAVR
ncbi:L,D-transpeptidase family protein [Sphingomonas sp. NSE70-1]|uniref:L,D-transpeptidase family protein n=1 Tax=Sphingomonas caseinilyticus TaxID=2908205 RepID=A0ABT0RXK7_9SPHN|nr:L,D-transpeptidase family protein [Sphingomonas caseinilyticus]MCL6699754.1 L,D-transpeptidase family protein [Sphingomonas caseinilyticus]